MDNLDNLVKEIKQDFFKYRNGIIAEGLRKLYPEGTIIFGLIVPQFMEMAKKYPHQPELAFRLWHEEKSRESRLFALYILPAELLNEDDALALINSVRSQEEAEFLAFRILRHLPFANHLLSAYDPLYENIDSLQGYTFFMLKKNLGQI